MFNFALIRNEEAGENTEFYLAIQTGKKSTKAAAEALLRFSTASTHYAKVKVESIPENWDIVEGNIDEGYSPIFLYPYKSKGKAELASWILDELDRFHRNADY